MVILLERRCGDRLSSDSEHERRLRRAHRQPFEGGVHGLIHGADRTRSLLRLLVRQVHDIRFIHCGSDCTVKRQVGFSLFFSPFFSFFPLLLLLFLITRLPKANAGEESGGGGPGGRADAAPWLSRGAASLQWLGEVKAPDNISIAAPAAFLGCRCFSGRYARRSFTIKHILPGTNATARLSEWGQDAHLDSPRLAPFCPLWNNVFVRHLLPSCCFPLFSSCFFARRVKPSLEAAVPQSPKFSQ